MRMVRVVVMLVLFAICLMDNVAASDNKFTITGKVDIMKEAGMQFYYIDNPKDGRTYLLGSAWEIENNDKQRCVSDAFSNDIEITVVGELTYEDGEISLGKDFICSNLPKESTKISMEQNDKSSNEIQVTGAISAWNGEYYIYSPDRFHAQLGSVDEVNNNVEQKCVKEAFHSGINSEVDEFVTIVGEFQIVDNQKRFDGSFKCVSAKEDKYDYPYIHGINLGMGYEKAKSAVRKLPIDGEYRASIYVYPDGGGTRSFIFFPPALRALYNVDKIDMKFLKGFLVENNLKGKQIDFETFSQKFMTPRERGNSVYGLHTPIGFFGGLFGYSKSTIFWDCGNFCVVMAPDGAKGHSAYIGFAKQVE